MQNQPAQSPGAEPAGQPTAITPAERPFLPAKHYPGDVSAAPAPPPVTRPAGGGRVFSRVVLPLVLFVAIVAGIAWVVQYLPSWRERRQQQQATQVGRPSLLFEQQVPSEAAGLVQVKAVWDKDDSSYAREFEFGPESHYDFPFKNPGRTPVQLGVTRKSCVCIRKIMVSLLSQEELQAYKQNKQAGAGTVPWKDLPIDTQNGITVPPDSAGIVRVILQDHSASGRRNFTIHLWSQTEGKARDPETVLELSVIFTVPVRYYPEMRDVGRIASGGMARAEFWFWSPTREHFALDVTEKKEDPCFEFRAVPLDPAQCADLQKRLKDAAINTRVRSGYRVEVTIHEERGGRQLDVGPFQRNVPYAIDQAVADLPQGPLVKGWVVLRDITVGNPEDLGHIDLKSFPINVPREPRRVPLWTPAGLKLELLKQEVPDYLDATLTEKETAANKTHWELRVGVRSRVLRPGPLEDSAIILRMDTMPPRRIRIPVVGTAVQR